MLSQIYLLLNDETQEDSNKAGNGLVYLRSACRQ